MLQAHVGTFPGAVRSTAVSIFCMHAYTHYIHLVSYAFKAPSMQVVVISHIHHSVVVPVATLPPKAIARYT